METKPKPKFLLLVDHNGGRGGCRCVRVFYTCVNGLNANRKESIFFWGGFGMWKPDVRFGPASWPWLFNESSVWGWRNFWVAGDSPDCNPLSSLTWPLRLLFLSPNSSRPKLKWTVGMQCLDTTQCPLGTEKFLLRMIYKHGPKMWMEGVNKMGCRPK